MYRADADGVGLRRAATRAPRVPWWATRRRRARAIPVWPLITHNPLTPSHHFDFVAGSVYDAAEWSKDGRLCWVVIDGRERSYVTESDSKVISA